MDASVAAAWEYLLGISPPVPPGAELGMERSRTKASGRSR